MKEGTTEKPSESRLWRKEPDHASTRNAVVSKENEHLPHMNQTRTLECVIELGEKNPLMASQATPASAVLCTFTGIRQDM